MLRSLSNLAEFPGGTNLSDFVHAMNSSARQDELRHFALSLKTAFVCPCVSDTWSNISSCLTQLESLTVFGPGHRSRFCLSSCSRELTPAMVQFADVTSLKLFNVEIGVDVVAAFVSLRSSRISWYSSERQVVGSKVEIMSVLGRALHGKIRGAIFNFGTIVEPEVVFEFLKNVFHERIVYIGVQTFRSEEGYYGRYLYMGYCKRAVAFARNLVTYIETNSGDEDTRTGFLKRIHIKSPTVTHEIIGRKLWIRTRVWKCIGDITNDDVCKQFLMGLVPMSDVIIFSLLYQRSGYILKHL